MAVQFIRGMQGDDPRYFKTIATSKHFAVHSGPELSRHGFDARISEDDLNDTYLYAFRQTVEQAHVDSLMCVYNAVDGVPGCASDMLLKQKLRSDWHFGGYVVSDCDAVDDIYRGHHYAKSPAEAAALAVKAGTDLDCGKTYDHLGEAVQQGLISEKEIDVSVIRLFTARMRLGMFDPPAAVPFSNLSIAEVASPPHVAVSLQAARESIVLLKNERAMLPLKISGKSIAVIGPAADDANAMLGNYNGIPSHIVTPLAGVEAEFGKTNHVRFTLGASYVAGWSALVPGNVLSTSPNGSEHGLRAEYFSSEDFTGSPALSRVEARPFFNWEMQEPALVQALPRDRFSVRWTGYLRVPSSGEYKLGAIRPECHACGRTDAARLFVEDKLLTADLQKADEQMFSKTTSIQLQANRDYPIRIEYTQHGGGGGLQFVWTPPADAALQDAVNLVRSADIVIACIGLNSSLEGEESPLKIPGFAGGDRTDIGLPESQRSLLQAVFASGKPVIVVLVNGSALAIPDVKQHARAIVESWYGGQEAGTALAETLSGQNNPAGRLPITFYQSVAQLPSFSDYSMSNRTYRFFTGQPLYPFGYGLSYSQFRYANARLSGTELTADVKNASGRAGDEVVEVYLTHKDNSHPQLRGFQRVHLDAGQTQPVHFTLNRDELKDRLVSVGGGLPSAEWTHGAFQQISADAQ
jgi:beta-glucosidase